MDDYEKRKQERREAYARNSGVKMIRCVACNGSGRYDAWGSPDCGCCGGTGKMKG